MLITMQVAMERSLNALHSRKGAVDQELLCAARWLGYAHDIRRRVSGFSSTTIWQSFTADERQIFTRLTEAVDAIGSTSTGAGDIVKNSMLVQNEA